MDSLTIVTAADQNYVAQAAVMAHTLSLTQTARVELIVLGSGWNSRDQTRLRRAAGEGINVTFVAPVDPRAENFTNTGYGFPPAATYSVLAAELDQLASVDRFLYLDADVVVLDSLDSLFTMEMRAPVAAVADAHVAVMGMPSMWRPWREEGADPMSPYLNTGVMAVSRSEWIEQEITARVFDLLARYDLPCVDQDALNLVLDGNFDRLPPRWNLMPYHLMRLLRTSDLIEGEDDLHEALTSPAIVHYHRSFLGKPWQVGCTHPARSVWRTTARQLGFRSRKVSIKDLARIAGARYAGMSVLDEQAQQLRQLSRLSASIKAVDQAR